MLELGDVRLNGRKQRRGDGANEELRALGTSRRALTWVMPAGVCWLGVRPRSGVPAAAYD